MRAPAASCVVRTPRDQRAGSLLGQLSPGPIGLTRTLIVVQIDRRGADVRDFDEARGLEREFAEHEWTVRRGPLLGHCERGPARFGGRLGRCVGSAVLSRCGRSGVA